MLVLAWVAAAEAAGERALNKPAFTATPAELLAVAKSAPPGDWPVVILRDQIEVSFDDAGRATTRSRRVFVVRNQAGITSWGTVRGQWRPFYQDKPVIRARVISPGGSVAELEPALATDKPALRLSNAIFSDQRHIDVPLPMLRIGDVVEQEVAITDREAIPAGALDVTPIGGDVPTVTTVIAYSAPAASKAHHVARKLPAGVRPRHDVAGGRERWIYEFPAQPARPPVERWLPGDVVVQPYLGIATAASWAAVARAYRPVVDQRIADGPASVPALPTDPSEKLAAITRWFHREAHYSAVRFNQGPYRPRTPAETLKRRFGDAADLATLLVALLRDAGIRADLALLESGPERELDVDLPGIAAFNHAIVRAQLDGRDVWIDPVENTTRPGDLPAHDQGRAALVIADDTTGLATTPTAPAANRVREVRVFTVAERGPARVTEVKSASGVFDAMLRTWFRYSRADDLHKYYTTVARGFGGALDRFTANDALDLSAPFEVTVKVEGSQQVVASRDRLDVYLFPMAVLGETPSTLLDDAAPPRRAEFAWHMPHVYEVEHRIVLPPGFAPPAATPDQTRSVGTASFTERRRTEDRTLIVTFRFETGQQRLTPSEFAALRNALRALRAEVVHIEIAHAARALSKAGKPRDAISECQRLIALHPDESVHHMQLADALLAAGAGGAARRAARKAIALAPSDAEAQAVLGWVLSHDTLGRLFTYNWDRAGALAAYGAARKLNPSYADAADGIADVLVRDAFGRRYESGTADLRAAVEAKRAALAIATTDERTLGLAKDLTFLGEFAEAEQLARSIAPSNERDRVIVVAVAGASGAKAAIRAAGELQPPGDQRNKLIDLAAVIMLAVQHYDVGLQMFAETGMLAKPGLWDIKPDKLARQPELPARFTDPRSAVDALLVALVDRHRKVPVFWDGKLEDDARRLLRFFPPDLRWDGWLRFFADRVRSEADVQINGDAGLWRAAVELRGFRAPLYFALDQGTVKMIGAFNVPDAVGRYVLRNLDAIGEPRAKRLLDWLRDDIDSASPHAATFKKLWASGAPSRDAILLAAALLAGFSDPDRARAIASRCASSPPDVVLACHETLLSGYRAQARWAEAAAQYDAILALDPSRAAATVRDRAWFLAASGRLAAADKLFDDALAKDADSYDALVGRYQAAQGAGQYAEAARRGAALVRHAQATPGDLNGVAWMHLFSGGDLRFALELARKSQAARGSTGTLNTIAVLEAELGELDAAVHDNWKVMEINGLLEPSPSDWYAAGRIHEQLGLADDAAAIYKRIPTFPSTISADVLARRRLAAMGRAPRK